MSKIKVASFFLDVPRCSLEISRNYLYRYGIRRHFSENCRQNGIWPCVTEWIWTCQRH